METGDFKDAIRSISVHANRVDHKGHFGLVEMDYVTCQSTVRMLFGPLVALIYSFSCTEYERSGVLSFFGLQIDQ